MLEIFAAIMLVCSLIRTGYVIKNWRGERKCTDHTDHTDHTNRTNHTNHTEGGKK